MTVMTKAGIPFPAQGAVKAQRALPQLPTAWNNLASAFRAQARRTPDKLLCRDSLGFQVTFGEALEKSAALSGVINRLTPGDLAIGIMLPPSVSATLTNLAVAFAGKWGVNLNYGAGAANVASAIKQCQMGTLVTTRKLLEKTGIKPECRQILFIEDLADQVKTIDKVCARLASSAIYSSVLARLIPGLGKTPDSVATVMFSSGSEGEPKGIVLTHGQVLSNILQVDCHGHLDPNDIIFGALPFGHSFGYTITMWTPAVLGKTAVYHDNPLDARKVGEMLGEHGCTIMACTPTLMRAYIKRCTAEQFKTVRWLLLGSEKLKPQLAADIKSKLGVLAVEGYGCTELAPVAACNVPEDVTTPDGRVVHGNKPGTVGQPVPGTAIAIVDLTTGEILPAGKEGLIFVSGPQVMAGYLNKDELTAGVLAHGWYCTGDIGIMDEDGFLSITDRLSRFAKVAGEMVPLVKVEQAILGITGGDELTLAVTAIPDEQRGERIIVVYVTLGMEANPAELTEQLNATDMVKLWIPKSGDYVQVAELPKGATGKLDLKAVKEIARKAFEGK